MQVPEAPGFGRKRSVLVSSVLQFPDSGHEAPKAGISEATASAVSFCGRVGGRACRLGRIPKLKSGARSVSAALLKVAADYSQPFLIIAGEKLKDLTSNAEVAKMLTDFAATFSDAVGPNMQRGDTPMTEARIRCTYTHTACK